MTIVGLSEEEQDAVFQTVASVLHLGNVSFQPAANDATDVTADSEEHLAAAAQLLAVDVEGLRKALTTRTRHTVDGEWDDRMCARVFVFAERTPHAAPLA